MYVFIQIHPTTKRDLFSRFNMLQVLLWTLPLFFAAVVYRASFVGLQESLDALGNVLQKRAFSPCVLHSSHQVLKSLCTGFPLLKWRQCLLAFQAELLIDTGCL